MDADIRLLSKVVVTGALGIRRAARELGGGAQENNKINRIKSPLRASD